MKYRELMIDWELNMNIKDATPFWLNVKSMKSSMRVSKCLNLSMLAL